VLNTVCSPVSRFILQVISTRRPLIFREFPLPLDLPIHPSTEGLIVVRTEAYVEDWGSMLILLNQPSTLAFATFYIIQVNMLIPR
jgi:hypothetical protein